MKRRLSAYIVIVGMLCVAVVSCRRDFFQQQKYEAIVSEVFPVDNVPDDQDWSTFSLMSARVTVNPGFGGTLKIYNDNPATDKKRHLLYSLPVEGGKQYEFNYQYPTASKTLYYVLFDNNGQTQVYGQSGRVAEHDFAVGNSFWVTPLPEAEEEPMWIRYCFDEGFPAPGDFDFNDIVLDIRAEREEGKPQVKLHVRLAAVGTTARVAAALRFYATKASVIESYEVNSARWFDIDEEQKIIPKVLDHQFFLKPEYSDDLTLYLFNDAHWAMNSTLMSNGDVRRAWYNTVGESPNQQSKYPYGVSTEPLECVVTLNISPKAPKYYHTRWIPTVDLLDPFIITEYNGSTWEIHTRPFKTARMFCSLSNKTYDRDYGDNYIWALAVPSTMRYPLEGVLLGRHQHNIISGAYSSMPHSFGEWARNPQMARDWYLFPDAGKVY